jgi:hypothetical protein
MFTHKEIQLIFKLLKLFLRNSSSVFTAHKPDVSDLINAKIIQKTSESQMRTVLFRNYPGIYSFAINCYIYAN